VSWGTSILEYDTKEKSIVTSLCVVDVFIVSVDIKVLMLNILFIETNSEGTEKALTPKSNALLVSLVDPWFWDLAEVI
jgi:hypothetical protein